jgi:hypothetical protein
MKIIYEINFNETMIDSVDIKVSEELKEADFNTLMMMIEYTLNLIRDERIVSKNDNRFIN